MKFISIGNGNMVAAHRVISVVGPDSAPIKRLIQDARDAGTCDRRFLRTAHKIRHFHGQRPYHSVRNQAGNHLHPSERSGGAG